MMTFHSEASGAAVRFGKELIHPRYDYVRLEPRFDATLVPHRWFGLKLASFTDPVEPRRVVNRLYLDVSAFDATGWPSNGWRLFGEYVDEAGRRTGHYDRLVDWGAAQTTLRIDGAEGLDFALLSLREIEPAGA